MKYRKAVGPDVLPMEVYKVLGRKRVKWLVKLLSLDNEWGQNAKCLKEEFFSANL